MLEKVRKRRKCYNLFLAPCGDECYRFPPSLCDNLSRPLRTCLEKRSTVNQSRTAALFSTKLNLLWTVLYCHGHYLIACLKFASLPKICFISFFSFCLKSQGDFRFIMLSLPCACENFHSTCSPYISGDILLSDSVDTQQTFDTQSMLTSGRLVGRSILHSEELNPLVQHSVKSCMLPPLPYSIL